MSSSPAWLLQLNRRRVEVVSLFLCLLIVFTTLLCCRSWVCTGCFILKQFRSCRPLPSKINWPCSLHPAGCCWDGPRCSRRKHERCPEPPRSAPATALWPEPAPVEMWGGVFVAVGRTVHCPCFLQNMWTPKLSGDILLECEIDRFHYFSAVSLRVFWLRLRKIHTGGLYRSTCSDPHPAR